tara:strand:- start:620 stop:1240 length:621 start_codon:yes stop_codon:yes gene_type:complete
MRIKICGLHPVRDVQLCLNLGFDLLGFIFYDKSPRNLNLDDVQKLKKYNKQNSFFTAVTVDPTDEFIKNTVIGNFDYIQLHGSEKPERVKEITSMGLKVIKAIKVKDELDIDNYKNYNTAEIILFDTPGMEKSFKFPESLISKLPKGNRYALAGSISENNVENLVKLGVNFFDLSSSLETKLGHKDHLKIQNFMKKIRSINENSSI